MFFVCNDRDGDKISKLWILNDQILSFELNSDQPILNAFLCTVEVKPQSSSFLHKLLVELDPSVLQLVGFWRHKKGPLQILHADRHHDVFLWNKVYISKLGPGLLRIKSVGDCHVF